MKDIEIIDIDYSGKDPAYKKEDEIDLAKISAPWIVPEEGPLYGDTVRVIGNSGLDLIPGTDFEVVEPVTDLTKATGKAVHLYVELKPHILASGGNLSLIYQRVGKPIISVKTLLQMLEDMVITGKPIDWVTQVTGKPSTYYSAWHSHDIKNSNELVGFGGLVELFSRLTWQQKENGPKVVELINELQTKVYDRLNYIQRLKWGAIFSHIRNYLNPHEIKPVDVNAGNIANNATATPQQDSEGERTDLYSTPMGFQRILNEAEPVSEEFISQNELPFGYYGSGIYLPPPITGSFEGLGGDIENGCFCLEGNGWLVGLMRAFDGRVKNLYYMYNQDFKDRNATRSPWLNTYVQYQHPVITAAGRQANYIIGGSNDQVLMIGDLQIGTGEFDNSNIDAWWIAASNSTFDPNSHTLKRVNMSAIKATLPQNGEDVGFTPIKTHIQRVGDWVYLFTTLGTYAGDIPANYENNGAMANGSNWQTRFFRVPYKDLLDPSKSVINFAVMNVNFDNLLRERRNNQPAFFPQRMINKSADGKTVMGVIHRYDKPVRQTYINRRKTFVIVPNPNNKRLARVKIVIPTYATYDDPVTGGPRGIGGGVIATYDWDVESNTWTLQSNWSMPTMSVDTNDYLNPTTAQTDYSIPGHWVNHATNFAAIVGSWVPGYGWVSLASKSTGQPPYRVNASQVNRDGSLARDYDNMALPNTWTDAAGQINHNFPNFLQRSPFGVAGFPRHYTDLYALTSGVRQYPIEIFTAENEAQQQQIFYRVTEGGADDGFINRPSLQSSFIDRPIFGRKTNSSFGVVKGLSNQLGQANRPRAKDKRSRGCGLMQWARRAVHINPGAAYDFSFKTDYDGNVVKLAPESDGSVILNLDLDYTLDTITKTLFAKANKAKQVKIPRALYVDMITQALGSHANSLVDIGVSIYLDINPGVPSVTNSSYSMWSCIYHLKADPNKARMIVGLFNWQVASTGADGIRIARFENMRYPFKGLHGLNSELRPNNPNNVLVEGMFRINSNSTWDVSLTTGLDTNQQHMEILDIPGQTMGNIEQVYHSAVRLGTPGNSASPRIMFRRRNNTDLEASVGYWSMQTFNNEYNNQVFANADHGWCHGVGGQVSGTAMDLLSPWNGVFNDLGAVQNKYLMLGATYVEGNWSIFINADVLVTFNGYSMNAKMTNWDLRDLADVYKNQTFYIYCIAAGSVAKYEVTKILRNHNSNGILAAIVTTDDFGIVTIQRKQSFSISGFPLTRARDMGVPVSSGALTEQGTYRFLKRSELYQN